ncbi:unnamed protein product [Microthlaspi erraticum]|uniref:F-box associated beta-propeller type 1 domain-containing protein n=1 Tax=Microthlaspi erraticum TaxID=1685480 RepID=A0A6D2HL68_9BRAS|nr:unnamed protein product [Microthlaspi erraticum]
MEIWITRKIEVNIAPSSWSRFLRVEMKPFVAAGSFFIDEDKKMALVSESRESFQAYIIGADGYFKSVNIRGARPRGNHFDIVITNLYSLLMLQV